MKDVTRRVGLATALAVLGLLGGVASRVEADVVVVTPGNLDGWNPVVTDSNGVPNGAPGALGNPTGNAQFVNGPAGAPLGGGSVNLSTGDGTSGGDGSAQLRDSNYVGTLLSSLTSLSYSTYVTSNNGQQFPYLSLTISTTGNGTADDQLYFEPPYQTALTGNLSLPDQGSTLLYTWQTWNALEGGWWSDNGIGGSGGTDVVSLATYLAAHPDATIVNTSDDLGGVSLKVGYASPGDVFNGYVQNLTIGVSGNDTTYDFEPLSPSVVPEPSSIVLTGIAGLMGLGYAWRRGRKSIVAA